MMTPVGMEGLFFPLILLITLQVLDTVIPATASQNSDLRLSPKSISKVDHSDSELSDDLDLILRNTGIIPSTRNHILSKRQVRNDYERFYLCLFTLFSNPECRQQNDYNNNYNSGNANGNIGYNPSATTTIANNGGYSYVPLVQTQRPLTLLGLGQGLFGNANRFGGGGGSLFQPYPQQSQFDQDYYQFTRFPSTTPKPYPEPQVNRRPSPESLPQNINSLVPSSSSIPTTQPTTASTTTTTTTAKTTPLTLKPSRLSTVLPTFGINTYPPFFQRPLPTQANLLPVQSPTPNYITVIKALTPSQPAEVKPLPIGSQFANQPKFQQVIWSNQKPQNVDVNSPKLDSNVKETPVTPVKCLNHTEQIQSSAINNSTNNETRFTASSRPSAVLVSPSNLVSTALKPSTQPNSSSNYHKSPEIHLLADQDPEGIDLNTFIDEKLLQISNLGDENTRLKSQLNVSKSQISSFQVQTNYLKDALQTVQSDTTKWKQRVAQLERTNEHLQKQNGQLQHDSGDQRTQANEAKNKVKYLEEKVARLSRQSIPMSRELEKLKGANQEMRNQISKLVEENIHCTNEVYRIQLLNPSKLSSHSNYKGKDKTGSNVKNTNHAFKNDQIIVDASDETQEEYFKMRFPILANNFEQIKSDRTQFQGLDNSNNSSVSSSSEEFITENIYADMTTTLEPETFTNTNFALDDSIEPESTTNPSINFRSDEDKDSVQIPADYETTVLPESMTSFSMSSGNGLKATDAVVDVAMELPYQVPTLPVQSSTVRPTEVASTATSITTTPNPLNNTLKPETTTTTATTTTIKQLPIVLPNKISTPTFSTTLKNRPPKPYLMTQTPEDDSLEMDSFEENSPISAAAVPKKSNNGNNFNTNFNQQFSQYPYLWDSQDFPRIFNPRLPTYSLNNNNYNNNNDNYPGDGDIPALYFRRSL